MVGASTEATLELWASSLRDVKVRIGPLFTQVRVAASAGRFLDGLLGPERRKTALAAAHMPDKVGFATKPRLARRMIERALTAKVPFAPPTAMRPAPSETDRRRRWSQPTASTG